MNYCNFQLDENGRYACVNAGCLANRANPARIRCDSKEATNSDLHPAEAKAKRKPNKKKQPTLIEKGIHFAGALIKWVGAGRPTRSEEEINELLEICFDCDSYDKEQELCLECGCCNGSPNRKKWLNKVAWATEDCPLGKWPKNAEETKSNNGTVDS